MIESTVIKKIGLRLLKRLKIVVNSPSPLLKTSRQKTARPSWIYPESQTTAMFKYKFCGETEDIICGNMDARTILINTWK